MISVSNIQHNIGGRIILKDMSVDIPKGKITALIGPNGAGKSTLLNLIARQTNVQQGHILLEDIDIAAARPQDLALRMAVVAQHVGVASRLRVRELVSFGRWPQHHGRPTAVDTAAVAAALDIFDLKDIAARFLDEISGGQRQRAFVAMAYAQDTDWLLLDEPLNNLDIRYAKSLMQHLRTMVDHHDKSVVIVIHDLNYALANSDHFIAIKDGKIAFAGETAQVATSSALSDLFETQVDVVRQNNRVLAYHH